MNRLYDKLAILLLCLPGVIFSDEYIKPVIVLIVMVSVTAIEGAFSGTIIAWGAIALAGISCAFFEPMIYGIPVLVYLALLEEKWYLCLFDSFALVNIIYLPGPMIFSVIVATGVAIIYYFRVSKLEKTGKTLAVTRDLTQEKNVRLDEKNKSLIEEQDAEVYMATLKERNRIAREIHDNVGHMLTRSLLQAGAISVINKDEKLEVPLAELKDTLDEAMKNVRISVHDLYDDSMDLKASIEKSIKTLENKFEVCFDYDMGYEIPTKVKLCFAGVAKESLSNVVRHSNGDAVKITVREHPGFYQLIIEDNGHPGEIKNTGIGLANMRERAATVGGVIRFEATENGFRTFLSVPVKNS
ncbi:MAG: sensor histidine kinase [Eubacterium sp.]|nr:sensor histidine kinase [Eubacterium sp.]